MKKKIILLLILAAPFIYTGCSVFEGRPEENKIGQAEGSDVWWNTRENREFNASQLNDQFGDQPGDANQERPGAIDTDAPDFNFND
ncbi:MAG: hypothetical protein K9M56_03060 [Victivallales bacterium]|nr:hypothetical protein [Victivallales bacterium]